jgi:hypothetical protein
MGCDGLQCGGRVPNFKQYDSSYGQTYKRYRPPEGITLPLPMPNMLSRHP